tara:strand:- start:71 stop:550 length:480 start_codon:yes stop_codon:yes gene_type:complete
MWQDKLKEIIYILENSNMNEIEMVFWGRKYRVKKTPDIFPTTQIKDNSTIIDSHIKESSEETRDESRSGVETIDENNEKVEGDKLLSPMPGTFYNSPSPDDPSFVKVGDKVKEGQILCIIEAMKIMNEIEAEFGGTISKVLVNNSDPVEYNQPLFIISK